MTKIAELIAKALDHGPRAEAAVSELAAIGVEAAPAVVDAMRAMDVRQNSVNLQRVVVAIRDLRMIPLLVGVIHEANFDLVSTAFRVLGLAKTAEAAETLESYLSDSEQRDARKSLAADALGQAGLARSILVLLRVADEASQRKSYELMLSAVIALTRLGNHERASLAVDLALHGRDTTVRPRATEALQHIIAPGVFSALQKLRKDKLAEVRLSAIDALFYLGVPESIPELMLSLKDKNATVSSMATARLNDLAGDDAGEMVSPSEIQRWWESKRDDFTEGVCHRLGKPIWLPNIIALLSEPNMRQRTTLELEMITGVEFSAGSLAPIRSHDDLPAKFHRWWTQHSANFKAGQLHKHGHAQDVTAVFQSIGP